MRLMVILHLDPCPQTQIELIDRCDAFQVEPLDQLSAKRSPESFNLSFRWSVTGPAVYQMNPEPRAQQPQIIAAEAGMIIQQEFTHDAAPGHRLIEHGEETLFGFTEAAFQIRNQPAPVIDEPENDHALLPPCCRIHQRRTMQRIGLPEFSAHRGFPAVSRRVIPLHAWHGQTMPVKQPLHTRPADLARGNPSGQFQFPQNQMRRTARIFSFHIEDQLL